MNISHTGGRSIVGALSHSQHHLASSTVDCHIAAVQTAPKGRNNKLTSNIIGIPTDEYYS